MVITFVDITARRNAGQASAPDLARVQAVIEQMPIAVLVAEAPEGTLVLANRRAATLFNQPYPLPFIDHPWQTAYSAFRGFYADGRPYEPREWPLARALATGETVFDEELDFVRADGIRGSVSMSTTPIHNPKGDMVAVVATFWDITERKRAEASLRGSEERFRILIDGAADYAIFLLDAQGRIASWNAGAERLLGFSEAEVLGQPVADIFTPEDRAAGMPEQELRLAVETGRTLDERWHQRKDGSRFWASGAMTATRDGNGNLKGFAKIMRDRSERKATDIQLHQALQSAQQLRANAEGANRAKDEFISTVSHELRTPLNTIRLWSRMFVSGKVQPDEVIEGGKMIDRAALAQQQLIDDLLDVSRMVSGNLRLALRSTDLASTVAAAIDAIRALADSRRISVEVDLSSEVGHVVVDPDRIQQVVWNLLANAVKFTPEGGHIAVGLRRVGGSVEIEITDTGAGIRAEFLPHIFDRFRQADSGSTRRYAGLGLGLAIAKQLTEIHGGSIRAESDGEGLGATFTVYLPLEQQAVAQEDEAEVGAANAIGLVGVEVLLVEDETMAREATELSLEKNGARVRAVESAARAHEAYATRRPDVIVADIGMPNEDGYALIARIRRTEQAQHAARVPAVAVTAFARNEDRERALAAGFDEHLSKPVDCERLVCVLEQLASATPGSHRRQASRSRPRPRQ